MAQIAHADHNKVVVVVHTKDMPNLGAKLLHIVAVALLAKFTEAAKVLPNLGSGNVHFLSQRMGGNPYHTSGAEVCQLSVITGKAPDNSIGDVLLFQCDHSYVHEPQGSLKIS